MKKLFIILVSISFLFIAIGCNREKNDNNSKIKFGYTCMTMNNPFFITLEKSIREEVEKNGDTLITLDPQLDSSKQIAQVEDMISQGVKLIFLNPVDWKSVKPALDAAKSAGVYIVNFDAEVLDTNLVDAIVVSDNYNAGFVCGKDLAKKMPNGGKLAIIDSPTMKSIIDRVDGFFAGLGDLKSKFTLVAKQDGRGQLEITMPIAEAILQAHPDVKVFLGGNDPTALGIIAALKTANKKDVLVYGIDGSPEIKSAIKSGEATATGAQSPINIGKESAAIGYKILKGDTFGKVNKVKTELINIDNVEQFGTTGWQ